MTKILIIAHGHPDMSVGGGEIAAYRQCRALRNLGHEVLFMARAPGSSGRDGTPFSVMANKPRDILFHAPDFDHFRFSQRNWRSVHHNFRALLEQFRPEIVHFHHYELLGLELFREVRHFSPQVPIFLTLHEYLAICHHHGQMVKTDGRLCNVASPTDCHRCFPERSASEFLLRELFIKSHFELIDRFIAPSDFLRDRYIAWGLAPARVTTLENGVDATEPLPQPTDDAGYLACRFGFFGQISHLKGIDVLIDAVHLLGREQRRHIRVEVNGSLQHQSAPFIAAFHARLAKVRDCVVFNGPYHPADLPQLMGAVGWVVVPSIWWENSPTVIQEAFQHGRPVLCADIGGMAEKVFEGGPGLQFRSGSASSLARRMVEAASPDVWRLHAGRIVAPPRIDATVGALLALYKTIADAKCAERQPVAFRALG